MTTAPASHSAANARSPQIVFEKASLAFDAGSHRNLVLHDIDLAIERGVIHSLIGPSGCGKSTLLKLLCSLTSTTRSSSLASCR